jgi:hypothetical protein
MEASRTIRGGCRNVDVWRLDGADFRRHRKIDASPPRSHGTRVSVHLRALVGIFRGRDSSSNAIRATRKEQRQRSPIWLWSPTPNSSPSPGIAAIGCVLTLRNVTETFVCDARSSIQSRVLPPGREPPLGGNTRAHKSPELGSESHRGLLYELVKGRNLRVYPDAEIRLAVGFAVTIRFLFSYKYILFSYKRSA